MITTREELQNSAAASNVVSRDLAESLYKTTRNGMLKQLLDKNKKVVIIPASLKTELFTQIQAKQQSMANARTERKGKGGRPRLQDPDKPENLTGEALRKYKNRIWQRQSRHRRGLTAQA